MPGDGLKFQDKFHGEAGELRPLTVDELAEAKGRGSAPVEAIDSADSTERAESNLDDKARAVLIERYGNKTPGQQATLAFHLEAGKNVNNNKAEWRRKWDQERAAKRQEHWDALMRQCSYVLGVELLSTARELDPPMSFSMDTERYTIVLRPFGKGTVEFQMYCELVKGEDEKRGYSKDWQPHPGEEDKPFAVHQDWRPSAEGPTPKAAFRVETIAEAVYLCQLQNDGYDSAVKRSEPMRQRLAEEQAEEAERQKLKRETPPPAGVG